MYHSLILLAGIKALYLSPYLPAIFISCMLICLAGVAWCSGYKRLRLVGTLMFSIGLASVNANHYESTSLTDNMVGKTIAFSACLIQLKSNSDFYQRLTLKPISTTNNHILKNFRGLITLSNYKLQLQNQQIGWCGQWRARLKPVHGTLNKHGFDYEKWAYTQSIKASGSLVSVETLYPGRDLFNHYLQYRNRLIHQLAQRLPNSTAGGFMMSLAIGERSLITDDEWKLLRRSGTSHLLAISGLHIGLVFALAFALANLLVRLCAYFLLYLPAQKIAGIIGLIVSGGYLLLSGLPLSGVRAWTMLLVVVLMQLFNHQMQIKRGIVIALMLVLVIAPASVLSAGFWLSFSAVAFILLLCSGSLVNLDQNPESRFISKLINRLISTIKLYFLLSLAMVALSVVFFGELSWVSPIANMLAIPFVSLLILPMTLIGLILLMVSMPNLAGYFFAWTEYCLDWLLALLEFMTQQGWSWSAPMLEQPASWLLLCLAVMIYFYLSKWPGRGLLALSLVPLLFSIQAQFKEGEFDLTVFDVGQGLSIWYQSTGHNILIDTGYGVKNGFSYSSNLIIPSLKSAAVKQLNQLIISHNDNDHAGGLMQLQHSDIEIETLYMSDERDNESALICDYGRHWLRNGVSFEFLTLDDVEGGNNRSCVLKISSQLSSILLPGDIEKPAEIVLGKTTSSKLSAQILVVPHHGSLSSSTPSFLDKVNPQIAIVSAGFMNRYKHPSDKVVRRYNKRGVAVYNTACDGAIGITVRQSGIKILPLRRIKQPFWRHQC